MTELRYGNLTKELHNQLEIKNIFTEYIGEFTMVEYPNYFESSEEIVTIIKTQESAETSGKWESIKAFCDLWDEDYMIALQKTLDRLKIPYDNDYIEYLGTIVDDLGALVVQLKSHYQRPRPFQVAYYTQQSLNPYETISGQSPSYPSGHAIQALFIFNVIAYHYEDRKEELLKLAKQVADSRIILGIHYPSDNYFGFEIVKQLMLKEDIKKKYFSIEE
jgi:hypothetical protein